MLRIVVPAQINAAGLPAFLELIGQSVTARTVLRDLLCREEPPVLKPGQFYLLPALAGAVTFVFCSISLELSANRSAIVAVALTFVFRALAITFNGRTAPGASGSIFENDEPLAQR